MTIYPAVLYRIEELCHQRGISINKLANMAGVANSTIKSMYYAKSRNPGVVTIKRLCDGLGITIIDFFNTAEFSNLEPEQE